MPEAVPGIAVVSAVFSGAYLLGSVPVAYVIVRLNRGLDLRRQGSSNIGAMNAYEVTNSRVLGISAGILDGIKGLLAVSVLPLLTGAPASSSELLRSIALLGVVCGHNYNVWLSLSSGQLEGGKGLAAAAGGLLLFMPWLLAVWIACYAAGLLAYERWRGHRNIIAGNVTALLLLPVAGGAIYGEPGLWTTAAVVALILPKHVAQVRDILGSDEV